MSSAIMVNTIALVNPARSPSLPLPKVKRESVVWRRAYVSAAINNVLACVDMCSPPATKATEPSTEPPMISKSICPGLVNLHSLVHRNQLGSERDEINPKSL